MSYLFPSFLIAQDSNRNPNTLTIAANATAVDSVAVTGTAQTITVPTDANGKPPRIVNFSSTGNFYVNFGTTAVVPTTTTTTGAASILNPGARSISGITAFSIIAPSNCIVTMEWYS